MIKKSPISHYLKVIIPLVRQFHEVLYPIYNLGCQFHRRFSCLLGVAVMWDVYKVYWVRVVEFACIPHNTLEIHGMKPESHIVSGGR